MVDGLGVGDVGNIVLRDRQNLATERHHCGGADLGEVQQPAVSRTGYRFPGICLCAGV